MKSIQMTIMIIVVIFLASCDEEGNTSDVSIEMKKNTSYVMSKRQVIVRTSNPTVVELETNISTGVTTAMLKSGSANIE